MLKVGQIVLAQGHGGTTFKITALFNKGQFATIEVFSVSNQKLLGAPVVNVPISTLIPFKEDRSQAAAGS